MVTFQHIVLTRFNVSTSDWKSSIRLNTKWLNSRLKLFEDYCFASLKSQINQNFIWLVFFDKETPENIKKRIYKYHDNWDKFIPFFVNNYQLQYKNIIKKHIDCCNKYLITSRIDNDDAYALDYVETVQNEYFKNVKKYSSFVINFNKGYVFELDTNKIYIRNHYINAFCSLVEPLENFRSVLCKDHRELGTQFKVLKKSLKPMWLQVIHGKNISNKVRKDAYLISAKRINNRIKINYQIKDNFELNSNILFLRMKTHFFYFITTSIRPFKRTIENMVRLVFLGKKKF